MARLGWAGPAPELTMFLHEQSTGIRKVTVMRVLPRSLKAISSCTLHHVAMAGIAGSMASSSGLHPWA